MVANPRVIGEEGLTFPANRNVWFARGLRGDGTLNFAEHTNVYIGKNPILEVPHGSGTYLLHPEDGTYDDQHINRLIAHFSEDSHLYTSCPWIVTPYDESQQIYKNRDDLKWLSRLILETDRNTFKTGRDTYHTEDTSTLPIPGDVYAIKVLEDWRLHLDENAYIEVKPTSQLHIENIDQLSGKGRIIVSSPAKLYLGEGPYQEITTEDSTYRLARKDHLENLAKDVKIEAEAGAKIYLTDTWALKPYPRNAIQVVTDWCAWFWSLLWSWR